ncbi:hypothetical protein BLNAU_16813 [Blattamonas nauphoetae]|uniref:Uncharacterized protein n=1 Tax=Blattamonas nauphoetae TaxID=2049346 RepID=A0ABQ9X836_9EUKA|nr:hypothetical protein BLNAU_16813 [Blattamonas nauphoetae]
MPIDVLFRSFLDSLTPFTSDAVPIISITSPHPLTNINPTLQPTQSVLSMNIFVVDPITSAVGRRTAFPLTISLSSLKMGADYLPFLLLSPTNLAQQFSDNIILSNASHLNSDLLTPPTNHPRRENVAQTIANSTKSVLSLNSPIIQSKKNTKQRKHKSTNGDPNLETKLSQIGSEQAFRSCFVESQESEKRFSDLFIHPTNHNRLENVAQTIANSTKDVLSLNSPIVLSKKKTKHRKHKSKNGDPNLETKLSQIESKHAFRSCFVENQESEERLCDPYIEMASLIEDAKPKPRKQHSNKESRRRKMSRREGKGQKSGDRIISKKLSKDEESEESDLLTEYSSVDLNQPCHEQSTTKNEKKRTLAQKQADKKELQTVHSELDRHNFN